MNELKITAKIKVCTYDELNISEKKLIDSAKKAVYTSYAPYSRFRVGVAVELENGQIITGSNQENAAFPSGLCAERTALFYANAQFPDDAVEKISIAAFTKGDFSEEPITPCGACRQVIMEVQNRFNHPVRLLLYGKSKIYVIDTIEAILPLSFKLADDK
ncbi:MAG: cytidine deaminase [Dysgonamonadaceae bacterium]|jgi:cytidine deaminase|nr:cytidine deaminase [Dysgonamonadaceae bacterium]